MCRIFVFGAFFLCARLCCMAEEQDRAWTLDQCIEYALDNNISIKQQMYNVQRQEISLSTSRNRRLPDLTGNIAQNFSFGRALTADNVYDERNTSSTSFGISTSAPIFSGGRIYNEVRMGKINLQAAISDCARTREDVALNVISAYLESVCQKHLVATASRQVDLSDAQIKRVRLLLDNGKASESDLAQIMSVNASDRLTLVQQQNSYMISKLNLSQLMELPSSENLDVVIPDSFGMLDATIPPSEYVYSQALGIKPQIAAEQLRLKSAQRNVLLAKSALYPMLNFNAGLGTNYYNTSGYANDGFATQMKNNFNQYIGFILSVPLFNRLATRNSIRQAKVGVTTQQLKLEETKKTLYKEIQQACFNAIAAQKQCESSGAACRSAETSFSLMEKKYENGKANTTEYQEAKTALLKAQANMIQSYYTFMFRMRIIDFYLSAKFCN